MTDVKYCTIPPCTHTDDKIGFVGDVCTICHRLTHGLVSDKCKPRYDQVVVDYIDKNYIFGFNLSSITDVADKTIKRLDVNNIPDVVSPLGKYWDQPDKENIEVYDDHAKMKVKDLLKLSEYNTSIPTGSYVGKMWRRKLDGDWLLYWYGYDKEGRNDYVRILSRKIVLTDADDFILYDDKFILIHKGNI